MKELAHAKVNLSLRVLRRREDGYHEIETTMVPITLCDLIELEESDDFSFRCDDPTLSDHENNLAVRAARLFLAETKLRANVRISLQKNIPHGAGLGGGSSDAAAVLRGLNRLFESNLSEKTLHALAASLGSDVPFFMSERAAICRGRGELIGPKLNSPHLHLLLLKPSFAVPTPWAYSRWKDARVLPGAEYDEQVLGGFRFFNGLERPVFEKFAFLALMKKWLLDQPEIVAALLSGSGSTIFAVLREKQLASKLIARARSELDPDLWACACETVVHSE